MTRAFEGKSVLVTGGGSGIGLETAALFAEQGATITICGRTLEKLDTGAAAIRARATDAVVQTIVADVTIEEQISAAVDFAAAPTGTLDVLFACAGGAMHMGNMVDADTAGVRATVDLNLIGSFLSLKHAARVMIPANSGSIVLMSSGAGAFPHRWLWAYGMSKAGVDSLCTYAAEELGDHNIRVNSELWTMNSCSPSPQVVHSLRTTTSRCPFAAWAPSKTSRQRLRSWRATAPDGLRE